MIDNEWSFAMGLQLITIVAVSYDFMHHYPCTGEIYLKRDINMDFLPTKVGSVVGSVLSSTQILLVTKAHIKKRDVGHTLLSVYV